MGKGCYI
ncbi:hypothetical protein F383_11033 [Gossypium arboreum]|nr:hypothetical protein F383_11033 [Gossypium arboreum]